MRLEASGLRCLLGRREALRAVDLRIEPGEVVGVLGPNGAGKTTLLRALAGLLRPAAGQVLWDGAPPSVEARRHIGHVGHRSFLYENLTAWENLLFYAELYGLAGAQRRAADLLHAEGLTLFTHEPVRRFSRGMQQRLSLCRAWLHEPDTMLLDEPWTGLDHESAVRWERRLSELRDRGGSAAIVLHDADAAARLCDRSVYLRAGRMAGMTAAGRPVGAGTA